MGHIIDYITVKKKEEILPAAAQFTFENCDRQENPSGRYPNHQMHIHETPILASKTSAEEWIDSSYPAGYYNDHAVRFRVNPHPSKKMLGIQERLDRTIQQKEKYEKEHSVHKRTSAYIGCPKCGSKLSMQYLKGEHCPLCRHDLRAETTIKQIKTYEKKIEDLRLEYEQAERDNNMKNSQEYWLARVEVHN